MVFNSIFQAFWSENPDERQIIQEFDKNSAHMISKHWLFWPFKHKLVLQSFFDIFFSFNYAFLVAKDDPVVDKNENTKDQGPVSCDMCSKTYKNRATLYSHKNRDHGIRSTTIPKWNWLQNF